jgi:hypothetical protein
LKEEGRNIAAEELSGLVRPHVERVVVDELHLALKPLAPTDAADLFLNPSAQIVLEGRRSELGPLLAASGTREIGHVLAILLLWAQARLLFVLRAISYYRPCGIRLRSSEGDVPMSARPQLTRTA